MDKFIINSEMRVGSRWVHYLLADILRMKPSPEIDAKRLESCQDEVEKYWKEKRIPKFHHATQDQIFKHIKGNYKVIGIVRNPRDRIVSLAFHQRYAPTGKGNIKLKKCKTDTIAVRKAWYNKGYLEDSERQFKLMKKGKSTKSHDYKDNYIWTCYEWLKDDILKEIIKILNFINANVPISWIDKCIQKNSFKIKSGGRKIGIEKRRDRWRRKGVNGDFVNWFDEEMLKDSEDIFKKYFKILLDEYNE